MPAIAVLVVLLPVLASLFGLAARSGTAGWWGWRAVGVQAVLVACVYGLIFLLPGAPVANGPVGATCPASHGLVADLRLVLAVAVGLLGIAAGYLNGRRGVIAAIGTVITADWLMLIGWWLLVAPYLCDFS